MPPKVSADHPKNLLPCPPRASNICKAPPSTPEGKRTGQDAGKRLTRKGLYHLVDANGHKHLVYTIHFLANPAMVRVCFVGARGVRALVNPDTLLPAPADIDLSTVDSWWQMRHYLKSRDDNGAVFFPPPSAGFKAGDFVSVCIPDIPPLPALVKEVYPAASGTHVGKHYRVRYSADSAYDAGLVGGLEVTGPGITFSPTTDFKHVEEEEEAEEPVLQATGPDSKLSGSLAADLKHVEEKEEQTAEECNLPSPVPLPDFTPVDARVDGMSPTNWTIPRLPADDRAFGDGGFIGPPPPSDPAFESPEDQYVLFSDRRALQDSASGAVGVDDLNLDCFESMPSSPF